MSSGRYANDGDTNDLLKSGSDPLAIHLANALEKTMQYPLHGKAADELRRLSAERDDLLEALQVMVNRFSNYSTDQEDQPKTFGCHHMAETCDMCKGLVSGWKAVQAARTAIAKATGEQA